MKEIDIRNNELEIPIRTFQMKLAHNSFESAQHVIATCYSAPM